MSYIKQRALLGSHESVAVFPRYYVFHCRGKLSVLTNMKKMLKCLKIAETSLISTTTHTTVTKKHCSHRPHDFHLELIRMWKILDEMADVKMVWDCSAFSW